MASITAQTVRGWYRVHKWTSLVCTLFLFVSCLTGLPLIFHDELQDFFGHEVRPASLPADAPTANLDRMVSQAKQRFPALRVYAVAFDDDEPRVFVSMTPGLEPKGFRTVIFDRHTGKQLETGAPEKTVVARVLALHRELFAGLPGELLMGLMALLFVVSLVSGALVYGPFMRKLPFGTYRKEDVARVRWFDLHNLVGIVTLAWMGVVGVTGFLNALSTPLFGLWRAQTVPALLAPYRGQPAVQSLSSVDAAVAETARALPAMQISSVLFPNALIASPRHYVVWTKGTTPVTSRLFTPALIDAASGQLTLAKGLPWYLRTIEVSRPLHFGDYGGLPLKLIWAAFDLAALAVLTSGVYLWLRKKSAFEARLRELSQSREMDAHA